PHAARFGYTAHAARHRVERWGKAAGKAGRIVAEIEVLPPQHFEAAANQDRLQIARAKIEEVARHVEAVPGASQQAGLARRGVGHLHDEPSVLREEVAGNGKIGAGIVEVLYDVEHRDAGEGLGKERGMLEVGNRRSRPLLLPGDARGLLRKIQSDD